MVGQREREKWGFVSKVPDASSSVWGFTLAYKRRHLIRTKKVPQLNFYPYILFHHHNFCDLSLQLFIKLPKTLSTHEYIWQRTLQIKFVLSLYKRHQCSSTHEHFRKHTANEIHLLKHTREYIQRFLWIFDKGYQTLHWHKNFIKDGRVYRFSWVFYEG